MTGIGTDEAGLRAAIEKLIARAEKQEMNLRGNAFAVDKTGVQNNWEDALVANLRASADSIRDLIALLRARSPQIQEPETKEEEGVREEQKMERHAKSCLLRRAIARGSSYLPACDCGVEKQPTEVSVTVPALIKIVQEMRTFAAPRRGFTATEELANRVDGWADRIEDAAMTTVSPKL